MYFNVFQESSPSNTERNSWLMAKLEKKPVAAFNSLKEALTETGQGFLVQELFGKC